MVNLIKGCRVKLRWLETNDACLSGSQVKFGATEKIVTGVVKHIRGNHPTNPTSIRVWVKSDEGGEEIVARPEWIEELL